MNLRLYLKQKRRDYGKLPISTKEIPWGAKSKSNEKN
jgi:hypothetical protein